MLNVVPSTWSELGLTNDRPPAKGGHATCISPNTNHLLMFGGTDPFGVAYSDLYLINLQSGRSVLCSSTSTASPPKRSGACLVCLPINNSNNNNTNSKLLHVILFGGIDYLPSNQLFGDVWQGTISIDAATVAWAKVETANNNSSNLRLARHSFASCLFSRNTSNNQKNHCLFIFGGSDGNDPMAEPALLDLSSLISAINASYVVASKNDDDDDQQQQGPTTVIDACTWTPIQCAPNSIIAAEMCSACCVPELHSVLVAGGRRASGDASPDLYAVTILPTHDKEIFPVLSKVSSCPGLCRVAASLSALASSNQALTATLVLVGGVAADQRFSAWPIDLALDVSLCDQRALISLDRVRPITRMEGKSVDVAMPVNFGIGHSLASQVIVGDDKKNKNKEELSSENMMVCVSGIFPNQVGHTVQVFVSNGVFE